MPALRNGTSRLPPLDCLGVQWTAVPRHVRVIDVAPRDGLQNEKKIVSTSDKLKLINGLADSGLSGVEMTSFVSPKWVPQMFDQEEVAKSFQNDNSTTAFPALVPNIHGFEKAKNCGVREVSVFTAVTESFNKQNTNCSSDESLQRCREIIEQAKMTKGMRVRGYISCALGCPYEGSVAPPRVIKLINQLLEAGCYEVSLGDTIGMATPGSTDRLLRAIAASNVAILDRIAMHFHDTKKQALANVLVSLQFGIHTFDASVAGLGGCPYAPGASGNLATESLIYMLDGMGIHTGVDTQKLQDVAKFARQIVS